MTINDQHDTLAMLGKKIEEQLTLSCMLHLAQSL